MEKENEKKKQGSNERGKYLAIFFLVLFCLIQGAVFFPFYLWFLLFGILAWILFWSFSFYHAQKKWKKGEKKKAIPYKKLRRNVMLFCMTFGAMSIFFSIVGGSFFTYSREGQQVVQGTLSSRKEVGNDIVFTLKGDETYYYIPGRYLRVMEEEKFFKEVRIGNEISFTQYREKVTSLQKGETVYLQENDTLKEELRPRLFAFVIGLESGVLCLTVLGIFFYHKPWKEDISFENELEQPTLFQSLDLEMEDEIIRTFVSKKTMVILLLLAVILTSILVVSLLFLPLGLKILFGFVTSIFLLVTIIYSVRLVFEYEIIEEQEVYVHRLFSYRSYPVDQIQQVIIEENDYVFLGVGEERLFHVPLKRKNVAAFLDYLENQNGTMFKGEKE